MITSLRGTITEITPPSVEIDANGVGYTVEMPTTAICQLPKIGEKVHVYTHLIIREDAHQLFGFLSKVDRSMFKELIKISGVGPKSALTTLSTMTVDELVTIVRANNATALTRVPGIGKKTAERLMVELKDRIEKWVIEQNITVAQAQSGVSSNANEQGKQDQELAIQALVEMGFNRKQSENCVKKVYQPNIALAELINEALKATFGGK